MPELWTKEKKSNSLKKQGISPHLNSYFIWLMILAIMPIGQSLTKAKNHLAKQECPYRKFY